MRAGRLAESGVNTHNQCMGNIGDEQPRNLLGSERADRAAELRHRLYQELSATSLYWSGNGAHQDAVANRPLSLVADKALVDQAWFRGLPTHEKETVRGAAAVLATRKAVLVGRWAAAQHGMWTPTPGGGPVDLVLPSGSVPPKSKWPQLTRYHQFPIKDDDIVELDGVRTTTPLRTSIDLRRLEGRVGGFLAVTALLNSGIPLKEIVAYNQSFEDPLPRNHHLPVSADWDPPRFSDFGTCLAYAWIAEDGMWVRSNVDLGEGWTAPIVVDSRLIVLIDDDPLRIPASNWTTAPIPSPQEPHLCATARGYRIIFSTTDQVTRSKTGFISRIRSEKLRYGGGTP